MPLSIGSIATIEAERGERVDEGHRWRGDADEPRTCPFDDGAPRNRDGPYGICGLGLGIRPTNITR